MLISEKKYKEKYTLKWTTWHKVSIYLDNRQNSKHYNLMVKSCPTLCDPMDYIVFGILQARILECVAFPFSQVSFQPRDWTPVSCIAGRFFTNWAIIFIISYVSFLLLSIIKVTEGCLLCYWITWVISVISSCFIAEITWQDFWILAGQENLEKKRTFLRVSVQKQPYYFRSPWCIKVSHSVFLR